MNFYSVKFNCFLAVLCSYTNCIGDDWNKYLECVSQWEKVGSLLKEMHIEKSGPNSRFEIWIEYRGFLHAILGVRLPDDWFYFVVKGENHDAKTGWSSDELPFDVEIDGLLNGMNFKIKGQSAYINGQVRRLDENGIEIWKTRLVTTNEDVQGVTGIPPRTLWMEMEISSDRKWLHVWGFNETSYCFYQKIDFKTGKITGRLVLHLLEKNYWEEAEFRNRKGRKKVRRR